MPQTQAELMSSLDGTNYITSAFKLLLILLSSLPTSFSVSLDCHFYQLITTFIGKKPPGNSGSPGGKVLGLSSSNFLFIQNKNWKTEIKVCKIVPEKKSELSSPSLSVKLFYCKERRSNSQCCGNVVFWLVSKQACTINLLFLFKRVHLSSGCVLGHVQERFLLEGNVHCFLISVC